MSAKQASKQVEAKSQMLAADSLRKKAGVSSACAARLSVLVILYLALIVFIFIIRPVPAGLLEKSVASLAALLVTLIFTFLALGSFVKEYKEGLSAPADSTSNRAKDNSSDGTTPALKIKREQIGESAGFTAREKEVFEALLAGKNATAIERDLGISRYTAKAHIGSIYRKANVHSQRELIDWFNQGGNNAS